MGTSATTEPNGSRRLSAGDSGSRPGTVGRPRERRGKKGAVVIQHLRGTTRHGKNRMAKQKLGTNSLRTCLFSIAMVQDTQILFFCLHDPRGVLDRQVCDKRYEGSPEQGPAISASYN